MMMDNTQVDKDRPETYGRGYSQIGICKVYSPNIVLWLDLVFGLRKRRLVALGANTTGDRELTDNVDLQHVSNRIVESTEKKSRSRSTVCRIVQTLFRQGKMIACS